MVSEPTPASPRPPVSVCLATCNGERYLQAQMASVLSQLQDGDELVVADDQSTDGTHAIVMAFNDARVRWLPGAGGRLGVVRNFERALAAARHDLLFLCDQDDLWLDGKVAQCVVALRSHTLVVTDCKVVDESLATLAGSFFAQQGSGPGVLKNLWRNSYLGCCMALRREVLDRALPIPAGVPMHDMWLGLVAQCHGGVLFLPQQLSLYRRHAHTASTAAAPSRLSMGQQLSLRLRLAGALVVRLWRGPLAGPRVS